jgi:hypothetical protein
MSDMQDLILDRLFTRLHDSGWTYTVDYQYSNRGAIRLIDDRTLSVKAGVWFQFAEDFCGFTQTNGNNFPVASCYYGRPRHEGHIPSVKSTPGEVIDTVVTFLVDMAQS